MVYQASENSTVLVFRNGFLVNGTFKQVGGIGNTAIREIETQGHGVAVYRGGRGGDFFDGTILIDGRISDPPLYGIWDATQDFRSSQGPENDFRWEYRYRPGSSGDNLARLGYFDPNAHGGAWRKDPGLEPAIWRDGIAPGFPEPAVLVWYSPFSFPITVRVDGTIASNTSESDTGDGVYWRISHRNDSSVAGGHVGYDRDCQPGDRCINDPPPVESQTIATGPFVLSLGYEIFFGIDAGDILDADGQDQTSYSLTISLVGATTDNSQPWIDDVENLTLEATSSAGVAAPADLMVFPEVRPITVVKEATASWFGLIIPLGEPLGEHSVTFTATDAAGNTRAAVKRVTVRDTTPPTFSPRLTDQFIEATSPDGAVVSFIATATDTVDATPIVDCSPTTGSVYLIRTTTVECTATDTSGNQTTDTFRIVVRDSTAPQLSNLPANLLMEATSAAGAAVPFTEPTATDAISGNRQVTCSRKPDSVFPLGKTPVTCTATDDARNTASGTFMVTVEDSMAPTLIGELPDISVPATSPRGAFVSFDRPMFTDQVDPAPLVSCDRLSGSLFDGSTVVTCSAVDNSGRRSSQTFPINVTAPDDLVPPTLANMPANQLVEATNPGGATVVYTPPTATDNRDPAPTVTCDPRSGSLFQMVQTIVTCTARDSSGNTSSRSFSVTIRDRTAPRLIDLPPDQTIPAAGPTGAVVRFTRPTATDAVDLDPEVSCDRSSGSTFLIGTSVVTCTARDDAGNMASAGFSVAVLDRTPPNLANLPSDQTVEATGPGGATVTFAKPVGVDVVDSQVDVTCTRPSLDQFPLGTTVVTCTARDDSGNEASDDFSVTVLDRTPPVLANVPANLTVITPNPNGATVTFTLSTAADLVDGPLSVACDPASGADFKVGDTPVTCSATDRSGNKGSDSFTVTVQLKPTTVTQFQYTQRTQRNKVLLTSIVLTFSDPMDSTSLRTRGNYEIFLRKGRREIPVTISSIDPDSTARSVTILLRNAITKNKASKYTIKVQNLLNEHRLLFDGDADGVPGGRFVRSLSDATPSTATAVAAVVDEILISGDFSPRFERTDDMIASLRFAYRLLRTRPPSM